MSRGLGSVGGLLLTLRRPLVGTQDPPGQEVQGRRPSDHLRGSWFFTARVPQRMVVEQAARGSSPPDLRVQYLHQIQANHEVSPGAAPKDSGQASV